MASNIIQEFMTKFFDFIQGFFKGGQSSTRLAFLTATFLIFGTWTYLSISKHELQPISRDVVYAYAIVVGGKTFGKYIENKPDSTTPPSK